MSKTTNLTAPVETASINPEQQRAPAKLLQTDPPAIRWQRSDWLSVAVLAALWLAFFWPLLTPLGERLYIVAGDFTNQFYPYHFFTAAEWWSQRVPLWNPYMFGGHPFQADVQTAVFYPLGLLVNLIAGRHGLSFEALEWQGVVDYALAIIFTFLFLRTLLRDRVASALGAVLFGLGGYLTSYPFQQMAMLESAVWLPLILLLLEIALRHPHRRLLWLASAGLAMATSLLGGHPQSGLYIVYFASAYLIWRCRSAGLGWRCVLSSLTLFAIVSLGAAAVQLLPTIQFTLLSTRSALDYAAASRGYDPVALPGLLMPAWRSENALYLGIAPLLLALVALVRSPRRGIWFWGVAAIAALILSFGDAGLLYRLFHAVAPGFAIFRGQERSAFIFSFCGAVLAAHGLAGLRSGEIVPTRKMLVVLTVIIAALGSAGLAFFWSQNDVLASDAGLAPAGYFSFLALLAVAAACYWLAARRLPQQLAHQPKLPIAQIAMIALVVLSIADVFLTNWQNNLSPVNPMVAPARSAVLDFLTQQQQREGEPLRVRPQNSDALPVNFGAIIQVPFAAGDSPIVVQRTQDLFGSPEEWRLWQLLNVKYVASFGQPADALEEVFAAPPLIVYRNRFSLPRAWVVEDIRLASDSAQAKSIVLGPDFDPGKTAVVERPLSIDPRPSVAGEADLEQEIKFDVYDPRRLFLHTSTNRDGLLVLSEMNYPGWQAKLDGNPVPIHATDYVLRGIALPSGDHRLEMVYNPVSFWLGLIVSFLTLVAVAVYWLLTILRSRKRASWR